MIVQELQVSNIRNISDLSLSFSPGFNFVFGNNGSGKTSLLEAIYLLHAAKSFRTHQIQPIIQYGASQCTVFAKCSTHVTLGVQKSAKETKIKINHSPISAVSELALFFPVVLLYQNVFSILDDGPSTRRKQLDWGVFHVEHSFKVAWKSFQRALNHRNKLLRDKATRNDLKVWDEQLILYVEEINRCRKQYLDKLTPVFNEIQALFNLPKVRLNYFAGWHEKTAFRNVLEENYFKDVKHRTTTEGPQRADLLFYEGNHLIKQHFSRGQKKLLLFAFKFAQASLLAKDALFLIDDIDAELDNLAKEKIMSYLSDNIQQSILTSLNATGLKNWLGQTKYYLYGGQLTTS